MWNGMFYKVGSIADHFDVVNIDKNEVLGIVSVTVIFEKSPGKEYVFDIDEADFEPDKEAIGREIVRQIKG